MVGGSLHSALTAISINQLVTPQSVPIRLFYGKTRARARSALRVLPVAVYCLPLVSCAAGVPRAYPLGVPH